MKPGKEDFEGIIECNLESPFIHFKPEECAIVVKYKAVVDAFIDAANNYKDAVLSVEDLITEIQEFPGKISEAASTAKDDITNLGDFTA